MHQLKDEARYPALETILARAEVGPPLSEQFDSLRLNLFGLESATAAGQEIPVAALGLLAAQAIPKSDRAYHLRLEPVFLQADISRVMLMHSSFDGFSADYQQHVQAIVEEVLADDGLELQAADSWTITLPEHPGVQFTSLDEAYGADISDCLPEGEAGRRWKRLANDIQMSLHAGTANEQLRQGGEPLINGVWFWGGGTLPEPAMLGPFDRVYSVDPVSAGLARLHDIPVMSLAKLDAAIGTAATAREKLPESSTLVDWAVPASTTQAAALMLTPEKLEAFCVAALARLKQQGGVLELHSPEIHWRLTPAMLRRFWRRPKPLAHLLEQHLKVHLKQQLPKKLPPGQATP